MPPVPAFAKLGNVSLDFETAGFISNPAHGLAPAAAGWPLAAAKLSKFDFY